MAREDGSGVVVGVMLALAVFIESSSLAKQSLTERRAQFAEMVHEVITKVAEKM
jgi:hypothetical protein